MKEFVKGMFVDSIETKYGEIIKISIKKDSFLENKFNEKGYLNCELKKSKEGKLYASINEYKGNAQ